MFTDKNLRMTQESFTHWLNQKKVWRGVLKIDECTAAKHKIILSWPKGMKMLHYIWQQS